MADFVNLIIDCAFFFSESILSDFLFQPYLRFYWAHREVYPLKSHWKMLSKLTETIRLGLGTTLKALQWLHYSYVKYFSNQFCYVITVVLHPISLKHRFGIDNWIENASDDWFWILGSIQNTNLNTNLLRFSLINFWLYFAQILAGYAFWLAVLIQAMSFKGHKNELIQPKSYPQQREKDLPLKNQHLKARSLRCQVYSSVATAAVAAVVDVVTAASADQTETVP